MRPILKRSGMAAALMVITLPLTAHHGNLAIFDVERNITLQGVVTKFEWTNPHVYIQLETEKMPRKALCGSSRPRRLPS